LKTPNTSSSKKPPLPPTLPKPSRKAVEEALSKASQADDTNGSMFVSSPPQIDQAKNLPTPTTEDSAPDENCDQTLTEIESTPPACEPSSEQENAPNISKSESPASKNAPSDEKRGLTAFESTAKLMSWDSTFDELKTIENSLVLERTPQPKSFCKYMSSTSIRKSSVNRSVEKEANQSSDSWNSSQCSGLEKSMVWDTADLGTGNLLLASIDKEKLDTMTPIHCSTAIQQLTTMPHLNEIPSTPAVVSLPEQ